MYIGQPGQHAGAALLPPLLCCLAAMQLVSYITTHLDHARVSCMCCYVQAGIAASPVCQPSICAMLEQYADCFCVSMLASQHQWRYIQVIPLVEQLAELLLRHRTKSPAQTGSVVSTRLEPSGHGDIMPECKCICSCTCLLSVSAPPVARHCRFQLPSATMSLPVLLTLPRGVLAAAPPTAKRC
jgi:hypothetical protein